MRMHVPQALGHVANDTRHIPDTQELTTQVCSQVLGYV